MAEQQFTTEELESEEWRPCPGYESHYSVSSLGRVRRDAWCSATPKPRILKLNIVNGYAKVALCKDNQRLDQAVHRLVLRAFLCEPPDDRPECNHKNGKKTDNRPENLEWVTRQENASHARYVLDTMPRGDRHFRRHHPEYAQRGRNGRAKLTEFQVAEIRRLYALGHKQSDLAFTFGVNQPHISRICRGAAWPTQ